MKPSMRMLMLADREQPNSRKWTISEDRYMPHHEETPHMGGYGDEMRMGYDMPESRRYKNGRFAPARYEGDNDVSMRYEPSMNYGGEHQKQKMQIGFAGGEESDVMPFSQIEAEKWMRSIENEDGTKGPHWSLDQTKQLMAQKGVSADPWSFWVVINSLYADHSKTLRKHGVGDKIDLYVDMAKDFLNDKDSIGGDKKVAAYYRHIVKHK